jgi:hypothetical protein
MRLQLFLADAGSATLLAYGVLFDLHVLAFGLSVLGIVFEGVQERGALACAHRIILSGMASTSAEGRLCSFRSRSKMATRSAGSSDRIATRVMKQWIATPFSEWPSHTRAGTPFNWTILEVDSTVIFMLLSSSTWFRKTG